MIMKTVSTGIRTLTSEELSIVAGGDYIDSNCNGRYDEGEDVVVMASSNNQLSSGSGGGSWMGGGWISGGTGGGIWGGGGERSASWLLGLGGGFMVGYSSDSATAQNDADQTKTQIPGPSFTLDFDPFTLEFGFNFGAAVSVAELHNYCPVGDYDHIVHTDYIAQ